MLLILFLQFSLFGFSYSLNSSISQPLQGTESNMGDVFSFGDAQWPISDVGKRLIPQIPDLELQKMTSEIDSTRIRKLIEKLVSFGTRHTLSSQTDPKRGIGAARDWIASEMQKFANTSGGRMKITVPGYVQEPVGRITAPVKISNVVARLEGSVDPSRVYVITGHYDSINSNVLNAEDDAPGANDDASGVAVMMELCRIMAKKKPHATVIFAAVAAEEQGLYGSAFLARTLKAANTNVEAMLNNDIVGSSTGDRGQKDPFTIRLFAQGLPPVGPLAKIQKNLQIGAENDSPARELGRFVNEVASNKDTEMKVAVIYRLDRYGRGGDHSSFLNQGYSAVRFTEPNENFAHQHQTIRMVNGVQYGDLPEFVDFEYVKRVAKVNMAALWSLANSPGIVQDVKFNATALSNDSKLTWNKAESSEIAGFEVVWRPTDVSQWTHALSVGNVRSATLPLSKDNVLFGVRSVGKNGYKSPAVLPGWS